MPKELYKVEYSINKEGGNLKILGAKFAKKNGKKGNIIYNNKRFKLSEKLQFEKKNKDNIKSSFFIIFHENIYDKSKMFYDCKSLSKFSQIQNLEKTLKNDINSLHNLLDGIDNNNYDNIEVNYLKGKIIISKNFLKQKEDNKKKMD